MKEKKDPEISWQWRRDGGFAKGDAQAVGEELLRIANAAMLPFEGLTAELVADAAKSDESALHGYFQWDDAKAARQNRLETARLIIRSLGYTIVDAGERKVYPSRAIVITDDGDRVYSPVPLIVRDEKLRVQMLADAIKGLQGWQARYHDLSSTRKDLKEAFRLIKLGIDLLAQAEKDQQKKDAAKAKPKPKQPPQPNP